MAKRKYKLEKAGCKQALMAVKIIKENTHCGLKEAKDAWDTGCLEADPSDPDYRKLIEELDNIHVEVYDMEKIQLPKREDFANEKPSYT